MLDKGYRSLYVPHATENRYRKELRIWDPNYGDTIQMKIHAIKKGNSFWWRMPTKEEKQEEIRSSISSNSHPSEIRKEEELKIAGADEDVFLDILSRI